MLKALRNHLIATNIVAWLFIILLNKIVQIFCIIEMTCCTEKCPPHQSCCKEPCEGGVSKDVQRRIPATLNSMTPSFGFGEGYYQMFVEEKQRNPPTQSTSMTAGADARLNPN